MSAVDLLPCPFCGSPDVRIDSFAHAAGVSVKCFGCEFELLGFWSDSHVSIAERWNRRAPVSAGKVKALVWVMVSRDHHIADSAAGQYSVAPSASAFHEGEIRLSGVDGVFSYHPDLEAATSAAQADHEARVLSALQPGDGWQGIESAELAVSAARQALMDLGYEFRGEKGNLSTAFINAERLVSARIRAAFPAPPASLPQGEETR